MTPIYDIFKTYLENVETGPIFSIPDLEPIESAAPVNFLGFRLNSPLGVPAGPLLNADWIGLAAKLGFDLPTYKTIRSHAHPGHPLPNIVFVEKIKGRKACIVNPPEKAENISITNSFGMPSMSPEFLMQDIQKANSLLQEGQVMIVSVVGTALQDRSFLEDFILTARLAKEAGAKIIEANFSCPNVGKTEGCLYTSKETVYEYAKSIAQAIHPIPLLLKVGAFSDPDQMRGVFQAAARAGCAGISGLNSVSMEVVDKQGAPALGPSRMTSGVCGALIRQDAFEFMNQAVAINRSDRLDLALLGCGGLMTPSDLQHMLELGANIAMSATGMMWDPFLARRTKEALAYAAHR